MTIRKFIGKLHLWLYYDFAYINQYNGEVLKLKDEYKDPFRIVLDGHFYLWLPHEIWWGRKHKQRKVKETKEIKSLGYSQKNHKHSVHVSSG